MTEVSFEHFKKHLRSYNRVFSIKYIDGVRYYFQGSKVVAKVYTNAYFILNK